MIHRDIQEKDAFIRAFSPDIAHHHLIEAYQKSGWGDSLPMRFLMWRIPSLLIPQRVLNNTCAFDVAHLVQARIEKARTIVNTRAKKLGYTIEDIAFPYPTILQGFAYVDTGASYATSLHIMANPANSCSLATALLCDYSTLVTHIVVARGPSDFTKVSRLYQRAIYMSTQARDITNMLW